MFFSSKLPSEYFLVEELCYILGFRKMFGSLSLVNLMSSVSVRNVLGNRWKKQNTKTDNGKTNRDLF